jgi:hypothetical protein
MSAADLELLGKSRALHGVAAVLDRDSPALRQH